MVGHASLIVWLMSFRPGNGYPRGLKTGLSIDFLSGRTQKPTRHKTVGQMLETGPLHEILPTIPGVSVADSTG